MSQSITVKIAGTGYPLKADSPEMEQLIRTAAEAINQKLAAYDAKFPDKSLSDKLSFVALNEAVGKLSIQKRSAEFSAAVSDEAERLGKDLEDYLENIGKSSR